jgi:hypothetical protein
MLMSYFPMRIASAEKGEQTKWPRKRVGRWGQGARFGHIPYRRSKDTISKKHIILDAAVPGKAEKASNIRCHANRVKQEKHIILEAFEASNITCKHITLDACI